jgi:gliding motility-associated-like protein
MVETPNAIAMKQLYLILFLVLSSGAILNAQCPPTGFPDAGDDCPTAPILCVTLDGYCNTINNNNTPQNFPGCGGPWTLNNDEWFAFYAGSTTITIEVVPSNCSNGAFEGLQGGIYFGCGGPVMDVQCNCTTNPFTLTSNNFIVGEIYWMVLDGCDGNVCDYTINVLAGSTAGAPPSDPGPITGPIEVCQGNTDAYSLAPVNGATIYNWDLTPNLGSVTGTDNNASVTWSAPGTAQLCVDVANACFANPTTSCITVDVLPLPTADLSGSGNICKEGAMNPVDLTINFTGTAPWEFVYSIDGVLQPPIVTSDNPYTLSVSSSGSIQLESVMSTTGGCVGTTSGSVTINETAITPTLSGTDPLCFGDASGSISTSVSGGTMPYAYQWTPTGSGQNPTGLPAGTYMMTVTDDDGCTGEAEVTLTEPPLLDASGMSTQDVDCNNPSGSISTTVTGGTGSYTFQWSPSGSGPNPSGLTDGTYFATVTDDNGCTDTFSVTIAIDTLSPVAVASVAGDLTCDQTTITISGNGSDTGAGITYQWTGPGIVSGGNTLNPTVDQPGSYTLTITNSNNGCTGTVTVAVGQNITPPVAVATAPPITCTNTSVQIDGTGTDTGSNFTYQWTGPGIVSGGNTLTPTVDQPGTYTLTVTNTDNGCETMISVNVPEDTTPPAAVANAPPITCNNPTVQIDGNGSATGPNITYQWTGPGIVSGATTLNPTVDQPGTYTLTVTDTNNGCENTVSVTVQDQTQPPNAVANAGPITCANPTITINGNGSSTGPDFTYQWTTTDGNIVSGSTSLNPVVDEAGTYTLTVTNTQTGCENTVSVTVGEDLTPPLAEAGPTFELTCAVTTVQLDGTGSSTGSNFTYQWTGPGIVSGGTTLNPTVDQPGTYTITVTNTTNGCETTDQITVTEDIIPPLAMGSAPPLTCIVTTVIIDGSGSSTGPNFTYQWTGPGIVSGGNTLNPVVNQAGTYTLTVTNTQNGCTETADVVVTDLSQNPDAVAMADPITCVVNQITIDGSGSSTGPNYTYQWTTTDGNIVSGSNQLNPTVDEPGTYTLVVEDTNTGCDNMVSVTVGLDTISPMANAGPDMMLNCGNPTINLNGSGSGASGQVSYNWTGPNIIAGSTTASPLIGGPGIYILTVTDNANGCQSTDQVEVTQDFTAPSIVILPPETITCFVTQIQIDATNSSSGPNFSFQWTTSNGQILSGSNTPSPTVGSGGVYTLLITNVQNQCTATSQVVVPEDAVLPLADAGPDLEITCALQEVPLFGFGSSQGPEFTYLWTTNDGNILIGETSLNPIVNEPGTYTLTVTNEINGCSSSNSTMVGVDSNVPVADAGPDELLTCLVSILTLNGTGSSSGPNFDFTWMTVDGNILSGANTLTPQVNQAGVYELTVVNTSNGCVAFSSVTVTEDAEIPSVVIEPPGEVNCNNATVTLDATASSSGNNYSYIWNTSDGNIVSGQGTLTPVVDQGGNYVLTIANNTNGCINGGNVMVAEAIDNPVLIIEPPGIISCTEPQLVLDASGSDTGPEFQYTWTTTDGVIVSGGDGPTPTVSASGTYELVILNLNTNCSSNGQVFVDENADLPSVSMDVPAELNCSADQIQLSATIGGGNNLSFSWTTPDGNFVTGTNTLQPTVDAPGTYELVVINEDTGCQNTSSVLVEQDVQIPMADAGPDGLLNCLVTELSLDGQNSDAGASIIYQWTTTDGNILSGASTINPTIDAAGAYILEVTNSDNTCQSADTVMVTEDVVTPMATIVDPPLMGCQNPVIFLDAGASSSGPGIVYEWTSPDGSILSGADSPLLEIDGPGSYDLLVTDTLNGCFATAQTSVTQDLALPQVAVGPGGELTCTVTEIELQATADGLVGNFVYNWETPDGNVAANGQTLSPIVDQAGSYTLVVTDTINQCTAEATVEITQNADLPVATIQPSNNINCDFSEATLDASGSTQGPNVIFSWSTVGGQFVGNTDELIVVVDQAGSYTLTVNDTINSCVISETIVLEADTLAPVLTLTTLEILDCNTALIDLTAAVDGATQFSLNWTTTDGNILSSPDSLQVEVDQPGTYLLSVLNQENGCSATIDTQVESDFEQPDVSIAPAETVTCTFTEITLAGNADAGGDELEYLWTTIDGNILSGSDSPNPAVDAGGTYQLTVTNITNGCSNSTDVLVEQDQELPIAASGADGLLNCNMASVLLDGTASSAGLEFNYLWTTTDGTILQGNNTPQPEVNSSGTYILTVTNQENGCEAIDSVAVTEDFVVPDVSAGAGQELSCFETSLNLDGSGSVGSNFSYLWTSLDGNILSGSTTLQPLVDAEGTYSLVITNTENGCTADAEVVVTNGIEFPLVSALNDGSLTCAVQSLELDGSGSDQGLNFTYQWTTSDGNIVSGANTTMAIIDQGGVYTLNVLNTDNGCSSMAEVMVPVDTLTPVIDAGPEGLLTCTAESLSLTGDAPQGADYVYSWNTPDGNILSGADGLTPLIDQIGVYELTVINQNNGCSSTDQVVVDQDVEEPIIQIASADLLTCIQETVNLDGTGSSVGAEFTYQWTTSDGNIISGTNTMEPVVDASGIYTLLVVNTENGCEQIGSINVEEDVEAPVVDAGAAAIITCVQPSLSLQGTATGNNMPLEYLWTSLNGNILSGANTLTPMINAAGIYQLTVVDLVNGCSSTDEVEIEQDVLTPDLFLADPGLLTCDQDLVTIDATASSVGANFTANWTTINGNIVSGANTLEVLVDEPGTYQLEVLNNDNGCFSDGIAEVFEDVELPGVDAGQGFVLPCFEEISTLSGSVNTGTPNILIEWQTQDGVIESGAGTLNAEVSSAGTYQLLITNLDNGCVASDLVVVEESLPNDPEVAAIQPPCSDDLGRVEVTGVSGGTPPYVYSIDGGMTFYPETIFTDLDEGAYEIVVQDMLGCESVSESVFIDVPEPFTVTLEATVEILQGESSQLNVELNAPVDQVQQVTWTPAEGLSCTDCLEPIASPLESTNYQVTVILEGDCLAEGALRVVVDERPAIYVPNIFSPDGDGDNDFFYLFARPGSVNEIKEFFVFSRWGEVVYSYTNFQPNDPAFGWDGTFRGQLMNPAVFSWYAEIEMIDGQVELFKGDVTLVR